MLDVDHVVGAELARQRELGGVAREAGDDDPVGAGRARRDDAARPRWPGPSTSTVSPGPVRGISTAQRNPAPSGLNSTAMPAGTSVRIRCTIEWGSRYM